MRFTVTWLPPAQARLATLWMLAPDQREFAQAADRIDMALRDDPEDKSTPLGKFWVYTDDPLKVLFHVDPADRMVRVMQVRRSRP